MYEKIPSIGIKLSTAPEFEFFDTETGEITWDFHEWCKMYDKANSTLPANIPDIVNVQGGIGELDIKLLTEITKGSKYYHKQIDFAKKFKVSPAQITRRMNFLNSNVVKYRILYTRSKIQSVDLVLFRGKCSEEIKNKLYNLIKEHPIPFDSGFELLQDGFMWRMNTPPTFTSFFSEFLWKISSRLNFYSFDHTKSKLYYFYDKNFNTESKEWNASRKEIYEEPLKWIEKRKLMNL
jgi:hypothetical protein